MKRVDMDTDKNYGRFWNNPEYSEYAGIRLFTSEHGVAYIYIMSANKGRQGYTPFTSQTNRLYSILPVLLSSSSFVYQMRRSAPYIPCHTVFL